MSLMTKICLLWSINALIKSRPPPSIPVQLVFWTQMQIFTHTSTTISLIRSGRLFQPLSTPLTLSSLINEMNKLDKMVSVMSSSFKTILQHLPNIYGKHFTLKAILLHQDFQRNKNKQKQQQQKNANSYRFLPKGVIIFACLSCPCLKPPLLAFSSGQNNLLQTSYTRRRKKNPTISDDQDSLLLKHEEQGFNVNHKIVLKQEFKRAV